MGIATVARSGPGAVPGIDLMQALLARAALKGYRVYILGAKAADLGRAVAHIRSLYPGIDVVGYRDGYYADAEEAAVANAIRQAEPDILFVAMSSPRKEYFLARHGRSLGVPFVMGVGGAVDILAGVTRRVPIVLQQSGLEWLFRLAQEPRRLGSAMPQPTRASSHSSPASSCRPMVDTRPEPGAASEGPARPMRSPAIVTPESDARARARRSSSAGGGRPRLARG